MPRAAGRWSKATRTGKRGVTVYIPQEQIERAMISAGLDPQETDLEAKVTGAATNWKGYARFIVEVRKRRPGPATANTFEAGAEIKEGELVALRDGKAYPALQEGTPTPSFPLEPQGRAKRLRLQRSGPFFHHVQESRIPFIINY